MKAGVACSLANEVILRLRLERGEIAAIARATGRSRPTIYRMLGEECKVSSEICDGDAVGMMACGTGQA
jgi:hypothetical protein